MAFPNAPTIEVGKIGAGIVSEVDNSIILSTGTFEDGIQIGRFAKLDTGSIDNMDASATPVVAGVIKRKENNVIEDGDTYSTDNTHQISYVRSGLVTVAVKSTASPVQFGLVYAYNVAGVDVGKATATSTGAVLANAEFIEEVDTNIWLIRIK